MTLFSVLRAEGEGIRSEIGKKQKKQVVDVSCFEPVIQKSVSFFSDFLTKFGKSVSCFFVSETATENPCFSNRKQKSFESETEKLDPTVLKQMFLADLCIR